MTEFERPRRRLIESLRRQGIDDLAVLRAFDLVPRHWFVPTALRHAAYQDTALPIGFGQSVSRPATHAYLLQVLHLQGGEAVLEIGTGSGFQTALLAQLAAQVYSIERLPELSRRARSALDRLGLRNVQLGVGDGTRGWKERAPFDAILVSARVREIPPPWADQLAPEGRLLVPVGEEDEQKLLCVRRDAAGAIHQVELTDARFVPLVSRDACGH